MKKFTPNTILSVNIENITQKLALLRKSIGAETFSYKSSRVYKAIAPVNIAKELTSYKEIHDFFQTGTFKKGQPFIRDGSIYFLYSIDHTTLYAMKKGAIHEAASLHKVHLTPCETIEQMKYKNKFERYIATSGTTGEFKIQYGTTSNPIERMEYLHVCKNCLDAMSIAKEDAGSFDFEIFVSDASDGFFAKRLVFTERTKYSIHSDVWHYPKDWKNIRNAYIENYGKFCKKCGTIQAPFELHHKNSIKGDCSERNLILLCSTCYEKEHPHLKNLRTAK